MNYRTKSSLNGRQMDSRLILDEQTLKRIPPLFILIIILLLGFPAIALNYFAIDFRGLANVISNESYTTQVQIRSYFIQILLQWSAFSLAAITVLLALTQYRLTNDKIALVIGLTILFSGTVEALHILVFDGPPYVTNKENTDALIWTFTNTFSGVIFIIGLFFLIIKKSTPPIRSLTIILLIVLLLMIASSFVYYTAFVIASPTMRFNDALIPRPYELIYLAIYLVIIFYFYPKIYRKYPNILSNCIFYMSITQVIIAVYLLVLSTHPYESAYNIAYFLKIIVYFIPFSCLIINYVYSYNSILESQKMLQTSQEKLTYIAAHDVLTNLYNRREFENLLDITIANSAREYRYFALFLIDIDNFKSINDTLGHLHGDYFLKQLSIQLNTLTRKGDILSRIGGDEFTVITSTLNSLKAAKTLAERIINGLNIPYQVDGKLLTGTVSIGISIYPTDGDNTEELLKNADIAMYNAKNSGKNNYRFYTEKLSEEQHRESEIESHLRDAIINNELSLHYQPQYNLVTRKIIGAEVLLRWTNKQMGQVSPDEFIPVAENSNLIISIGNWVLHKACEQAKLWSEKYKQHLLFSINVSPIQFENNSFFQNFKTTLNKFDYPAKYIIIEITESLLMKNNEVISSGLTNIGKLGTSISLDDFGMGYSSLSRLKLFPINTLKIDKLFVADINNMSDKVVVIDTIIKLAHELEINTLAEGIETEAQLNYLVSRKCVLGQGFYLSQPLTAEAFEKLVYP